MEWLQRPFRFETVDRQLSKAEVESPARETGEGHRFGFPWAFIRGAGTGGERLWSEA
jgi:hypothetical protein